MKASFILVGILLTVPAAAQSQSVLLRWHIDPDSALAFRTVMRAVEAVPDSDVTALFPSAERADYTTVLRQLEDDLIGVEVIQGTVEFANDEAADDSIAAFYQMLHRLQQSLGPVQLRGQINSRGEITSFWLPQQQKNLLALFFELPDGPVSVGEVWSLEGASLLFLSGPYVVDQAEKKNEVRLISIEAGENGPVARLEYDLFERVAGDFGHLELAFTGTGEFIVETGSWQRFGGFMRMENTIIGSQTTVQEFALEPVEVPQSQE